MAKVPPLRRGRHVLPHQSQVVGRDLTLAEIKEHAGKEAHAWRLTPEQVEERRRGQTPGLGLPYEILVHHPSSSALSWTAFFTPDDLAAWAEAYGCTYELPSPGNPFRIRLPQHIGVDQSEWMEKNRRAHGMPVESNEKSTTAGASGQEKRE